jgi:protein involved in polysaccharide export with SLBB domain
MKTRSFILIASLAPLLLLGGCQTTEPGPIGQKEAQAEVNLATVQSKEIIQELKTTAAKSVFQSGDKIAVQIWLKDKVTQLAGYPLELEVGEAGQVFMPHLGLVTLSGKSVPEVQVEFQASLAKNLNDVTVIVARKAEKAFGGRDGLRMAEAGRHYIIMGFIGQPGVYPLEHGLRVREAIAIAGGLKHYARANIYLVRGELDKPEVKRVNMNDIFFGDNLQDNVLLQANDAIYVSTKGLYQVADFIQLLLSPITSIRDSLWVYDRLMFNQE